MNKRSALIAGGILAIAIAGALMLYALRSNLVFFFTPTQVVAGEAPKDRVFRLGGLVKQGSLQRKDINMRFVVTDTTNEIPVSYSGMLPNLFKEGKGMVAQGRLGPDNLFVAIEVLAKHDENYMPTPVKQAIGQARQ